MLIFYEPKRHNIKKYLTFCGGINVDGVRNYKQNHYIYLLTKYIKRIPWRIAVRLSYVQDAWYPKVNVSFQAGASTLNLELRNFVWSHKFERFIYKC